APVVEHQRIGTQAGSQPRHVALHVAPRVRGEVLAPQHGAQRVERHGGTVPQRERGEDRAPTRAGDGYGPPIDDRTNRSEKSDLEHAASPTSVVARWRARMRRTRGPHATDATVSARATRTTEATMHTTTTTPTTNAETVPSPGGLIYRFEGHL